MINLEIRRAVREDAGRVALAVVEAIGMTASAEDMELMKASCADDKSMYSWRNAIMAVVDGETAGCILAYPGDDYLQMREYTWSRLWKDLDEETIRATEVEALPGEYYLDTMALDERYRGHEIGKRLMKAAMEYGRKLGCRKFSLLVDVDKPRLRAYYESLGFSLERESLFLGHRYHRLVLDDMRGPTGHV